MNTLEHITIIPDGNRRFSKKNNLTKKDGYTHGERKLNEIVDYISDNFKEVKFVTVMGFSYDNLIKRDADENKIIMDLLLEYINNIVELSNERSYKLRFSVSDEKLLNNELLEKMKKAELATENNLGLCINLQIAYGSKQSIIKSVNQLILNNLDVNEKSLSRELTKSLTSYCENMPDPNLVIRTSGETRLSNEMLYEFAYTEIFFVEKLWPEFTITDLNSIIEKYKNKERRFGK